MAFISLVVPAMASAVVRYADPNGATATSNCTSSDPTDLTNPPCEIERAVETVSVSGDEVILLPGDYNEGASMISVGGGEEH